MGKRIGGKINPNTGRRMFVVGVACVLGYFFLPNSLIIALIAGLGLLTATTILGGVIDPQWLLGVVVRPLYKYLTKKYYDLYAATSAPDDEIGG